MAAVLTAGADVGMYNEFLPVYVKSPADPIHEG